MKKSELGICQFRITDKGYWCWNMFKYQLVLRFNTTPITMHHDSKCCLSKDSSWHFKFESLKKWHRIGLLHGYIVRTSFNIHDWTTCTFVIHCKLYCSDTIFMFIPENNIIKCPRLGFPVARGSNIAEQYVAERCVFLIFETCCGNLLQTQRCEGWNIPNY